MMRVADAFAQAIKGIFRNGLASFVCVFVLISCLVFVGSFAMISVNVDYNLDRIAELNEIEVFLEYELDDAAAAEINAAIEALDNVSGTTLYSKEEGLEEMKNEFSDYAPLFENISAEDNPLSHRIVVIYEDNAMVADLVFGIEQIKGVRDVKARPDIAASVEALQSGLSIVFAWFAVLCTIICMFVIVNTIKLSVYARREEITIMRYIGASRSYISAPFVLEGVFIGVIGAGVAFFIEKLVYSGLMSFVGQKMGFVALYGFNEISNGLLAAFFGISLFCGIAGSLFSLGKYVEV